MRGVLAPQVNVGLAAGRIVLASSKESLTIGNLGTMSLGPYRADRITAQIYTGQGGGTHDTYSIALNGNVGTWGGSFVTASNNRGKIFFHDTGAGTWAEDLDEATFTMSYAFGAPAWNCGAILDLFDLTTQTIDNYDDSKSATGGNASDTLASNAADGLLFCCTCTSYGNDEVVTFTDGLETIVEIDRTLSSGSGKLYVGAKVLDGAATYDYGFDYDQSGNRGYQGTTISG